MVSSEGRPGEPVPPLQRCVMFQESHTNKNVVKSDERSSHCRSAETNLNRNHEVVGSIPGLAQWVKVPALPLAVV